MYSSKKVEKTKISKSELKLKRSELQNSDSESEKSTTSKRQVKKVSHLTAKKKNIIIDEETSNEETREPFIKGGNNPSIEEAEEDLTACLTDGKDMICRDEEKKIIRNFLTEPNKKGLYISGQPGTGKTSLVIQTVKHLKNVEKKIFEIYLNCMSCQSVEEFYSKIFQAFENNIERLKNLISDSELKNIQKTRIGLEKLKTMLECLVEKINNANIYFVIILDEVDYIYGKFSQIEADEIIRIPYLSKNTVKLIMISNDTNFENKIFPDIKDKKYHVDKFIMKPYTHQQIFGILKAKLENMKLLKHFHNDALLYISKKYANKIGDLRPALDKVKVAILNYFDKMKKDNHVVSLKEIISLINKKNDNFNQILSNLTFEQKIVVASIYDILNKREISEFSEKEIYEKYKYMKKLEFNGEYNITDFKEILKSLCDLGVIEVKSKIKNTQFKAKYTTADLEMIFSDDTIFKLFKPTF